MWQSLTTKLWNDDYDKLKTEFEELVQTENNRVYTAYYNEKCLRLFIVR